jgi:hypothetical protein
MISFLGESDSCDIQIPSDSEKIAPEGFYTSAWEWRMNLKLKDPVDCCDEYHQWYSGYVLAIEDLEHTDVLGQQCKRIKIAFRYYDKDFGYRMDPQGQAFVGWSEKYDSWRSFTCTSI